MMKKLTGWITLLGSMALGTFAMFTLFEGKIADDESFLLWLAIMASTFSAIYYVIKTDFGEQNAPTTTRKPTQLPKHENELKALELENELIRKKIERQTLLKELEQSRE